MSNPKTQLMMFLCRSSLLLLLLVVACAGPSPAPEPKQPEPPQSPTLANVLAEHTIAGIDLHLAAPFRREGNVRSPVGFVLEREHGLPGRCYATAFTQGYGGIAVYFAEQPETLGFAVRVSPREIGDERLQSLGMHRGQRLGIVQAEEVPSGFVAYETDRPGILVVGPWLVVVHSSELLTHFQLGEGAVLAEHAIAQIESSDKKEVRRARSTMAKLIKIGGESKEHAERIQEAIDRKNAAFLKASDDAWQETLRVLTKMTISDALGECDRLRRDPPKFANFAGVPLESNKHWQDRARETLIKRVRAEVAGRTVEQAPLQHALLYCMTRHWFTSGMSSVLASRLHQVARVKTLEELGEAYGEIAFFHRRAAPVGDWVRRMMAGIIQHSRGLMRTALASAKAGSLRRLALEELVASDNQHDPITVARLLTTLAPLEREPEVVQFMAFYGDADFRVALPISKLSAELERRSATLIALQMKAAEVAGRPVEMAMLWLAQHCFTAKEGPVPATLSDYLDPSQHSTALDRARALLAPQLLEIVPLSRNEGGTLDTAFRGFYARQWPLVTMLGLDVGHSARLHEFANRDVPQVDQVERHLVTSTDPWHWAERSSTPLLFNTDPMAWARMGTMFTSKELTDEAKALIARLKELKERRKSLEDRTEAQVANYEARQKQVEEFNRALKEGRRGQESNPRAQALNQRGAELNREAESIQAAIKVFQKDVKKYNEDRAGYFDSRSGEQGKKHQDIRKNLHASLDQVIESGLQAWSVGKVERDVDTMRWLLGRPRDGFARWPDLLPAPTARITRELDQDEADAFQGMGKKEIGEAIAKYWDRLSTLRWPDRLQRARRLTDKFLNRFGMTDFYSYVYMLTNYRDSLKNDVLSKEQQEKLAADASRRVREYREWRRKQNANK